MDIVSEVLEKAAREEQLNTTVVHKHLDVEIDEGTLLVMDYNSIDTQKFKASKEDYLRQLARDNVQLLINKIWELPTKRVEETIVAELPPPKFVLPRAQRVPKPKPLTKWQEFAKAKGITSSKKKKAKLSWDAELQKWIPNYGFKRAQAEKEKDWLIEVKDNADPNVNLFEKKSTEKQERQSKNELQRLRNIARAKNIKVPRVGIPSSNYYPSTQQLSTAVTIARSSTASVGKFQNKLPKEKDAKNVKDMVPGSKKVKIPIYKPADEIKRHLDFVDKIISKKPLISMPTTSTEAPIERSKGTTRKKAGGKVTKRGAKKPKAGKGKRDPHTKVGGRKRRQKS